MAGNYGTGRSADAALMILGLRNALRACDRIGATVTEQAGADIRSQLDKFRADIPEATNARDVLEHFDEYRDGRGRLQRSTPFTFDFRVGGCGQAVVVDVGPYSLPVVQVHDACNWLTTYGAVAIMRAAGGSDASQPD